jgi:hypothetical protein
MRDARVHHVAGEHASGVVPRSQAAALTPSANGVPGFTLQSAASPAVPISQASRSGAVPLLGALSLERLLGGKQRVMDVLDPVTDTLLWIADVGRQSHGGNRDLYERSGRRCKKSGMRCQRRPVSETSACSGTLGSRSAVTSNPDFSRASK